MAETDYDGSAIWDTPKVAEVGDGSGTFWDNSFKPLANRVKYLKDTIGQAAVAAYVGASFQIAAGPLQTFLQLLADKAGKLDGSNTWSGSANTFLALAVQYAVLPQLGTITDAATAQIGITKWVWIASSVSQQIDVELDDTNAQDGHFIIVGRDAAGANTVIFHRPGPAAGAIVTLGSSHAAGAILIRRGGVWRLLFGGQNTTEGLDA